jgi:hypothetical protein
LLGYWQAQKQQQQQLCAICIQQTLYIAMQLACNLPGEKVLSALCQQAALFFPAA